MSAATHPPSTTGAERTSDAAETRSVKLRFDEDDIAVVQFDRPGSSANVLDSNTLHALADLLGELERRSLRGVIFESAKRSVFIAGADLKELAGTQRRAELVDLGQQTFAKIAALKCVTVAAIHGACAGGGLELSLACDYRVASHDRSTRIGLPEVNLGLIPAWGGSTRLPRIIGLPRALKVILRGELMAGFKGATRRCYRFSGASGASLRVGAAVHSQGKATLAQHAALCLDSRMADRLRLGQEVRS